MVNEAEKKEQDSKADDLREHLAIQTRSVIEKAKTNNGLVSVESLDTLNRLEQLLELSQKLEKSTSSRRWPAILAFVFTLAFISFLLTPISEMDIELELKLSELEFTGPKNQNLTREVLNLSSIGVSGLQKIILPNVPEINNLTDSSAFIQGDKIRISTLLENELESSLTLDLLLIKNNTRVQITNLSVPNNFRISFFYDQQGAIENSSSNRIPSKESDQTPLILKPLQLSVFGSIQIESPEIIKQKIELKTPKSFYLYPEPEQLQLDIVLPDDKSINLATQLWANNFSFYKIDEYIELEQSISSKVSTILSGAYYLESLKNEKYLIRSGEIIGFKHIEGKIRSLQLKKDHIFLKFHGSVEGMYSGSEANIRSLMPSHLERLMAHQGLALFWGAILNVFLLILGILKWWGIKI